VVSRWLTSRTRRVLDVVLSSLALLVLSPVLAALAAAIRVTMGRPVFYVHHRAGKDGESFGMVKLRSMQPEYDKDGRFVEDVDRITKLGHFMRATSLDEIPELFNVVRGQMSLVGPRPLLLEYLDRYTPEQAQRLLVRPGLTGLAQVSGRNAISWDDRFRLDVEYVRTATPRDDVSILVRTVTKVLRRDGISSGEHVSVSKFMGAPAADAAAPDVADAS
jgi:sugar transferase EpsL